MSANFVSVKQFLLLHEAFCVRSFSVLPGGGWKSSDGTPTNYEDWAGGQPTADGDCVAVSNADKKLTNLDCDTLLVSYCFSDNLVLVKENKTWEEALEHCRAMDSADPLRNDLISLSGPSDLHTVWSRVNEATTNEVVQLYI